MNNDDDNQNQNHDLLIPIANVGRLMKRMLPPGTAKVSKEAKETMQECATEFISFVTAEASDRCRQEKRKTVNGDDLCWALQSLGFDDYVGPLRRYLHRYREVTEANSQQNASTSTNPRVHNNNNNNNNQGEIN